ncbi:hypothetical protein BVG19_g4955 [[Candida] boidinii]|nr:hypothetical protein BVG19_g4955 [[Candida] boidinii]OWB51307.1 hypothetical protein B5S27_g2867 [[Candida] boidinii]
MSILQTQHPIQNSTTATPSTASVLNNPTSNMTVDIPIATNNKDKEDSTINNKSVKEIQQEIPNSDSVDTVMESPSDSTTEPNNTSSSSSSSQKPKRHRAPPPPLNIPPLRQSARSAVRFHQVPQVSVYNNGYIHSTRSQTPTSTTHFGISKNDNTLTDPSPNVTISASPSTSVTSITSNALPKSTASPISTESVTSSVNLSSTTSGLARTRAPAPVPGNVQTPSSANVPGNQQQQQQQYQTISFPMHTQPILIPTTLANGTVANIVYQPTYNPLIPYAPQFVPQQMLTPMSNQEKTVLGPALSSRAVRTIGATNTTANNISASTAATTSNIPQSAKRTYFVSSNSDNELILTSPSESVDPYKRQKTCLSPPMIRQAAALGYPNGITVVSSPIVPKMAVSSAGTILNTPLIPVVGAPLSSDKQQKEVATSKTEDNTRESKEDDDEDDDEDDEDDVEANAIEDDAMATPFPKDAKDVKSRIVFGNDTFEYVLRFTGNEEIDKKKFDEIANFAWEKFYKGAISA